MPVYYQWVGIQFWNISNEVVVETEEKNETKLNCEKTNDKIAFCVKKTLNWRKKINWKERTEKNWIKKIESKKRTAFKKNV